MKHFIATLTLTAFALQANASAFAATPDFACKNIYEAKFQRIEHHKVLRKIGDYAVDGIGFAFGTAAVAGAGLLMGVTGLGGLIVFFSPVLGGEPAAFQIDELSLFDREPGLRSAYQTFTTLDVSAADLMKAAAADYDAEKLKEASWALGEINIQRKELGMPLETIEEYLKNYPIPQYAGSRYRSTIDQIIEGVGLKHTGDQDWNDFVDRYANAPDAERYDGARELLMKKAATTEFCPKEKALTLRQIIKTLKTGGAK